MTERQLFATFDAGSSSSKDAFRHFDTPTPTGWTIAEAFYAALYLAVTCDDSVTREEREEAIAVVHRSRLLQSIKPVRLSEIKRNVPHRIRYETGIIKAICATLRKEMRLPTFAHTLDIMLSDGELTQDEADLLNTMMIHFELSGEDVRRVTDVIVMKNRF